MLLAVADGAPHHLSITPRRVSSSAFAFTRASLAFSFSAFSSFSEERLLIFGVCHLFKEGETSVSFAAPAFSFSLPFHELPHLPRGFADVSSPPALGLLVLPEQTLVHLLRGEVL